MFITIQLQSQFQNIKMICIKKLLFFIFGLLAIQKPVAAQSTITRNAIINVRVNPYTELDLSFSGNSNIRFNTSQELNDGIILSNRFTVRINTNQNWVLNASSLTSNFLSIGPNSPTQMPASVLSIKKNSDETFIPFSLNPSPVATGSRGTRYASGNDFKLDLKASPGLDYDGGSFALVLVFTLTAQ